MPIRYVPEPLFCRFEQLGLTIHIGLVTSSMSWVFDLITQRSYTRWSYSHQNKYHVIDFYLNWIFVVLTMTMSCHRVCLLHRADNEFYCGSETTSNRSTKTNIKGYYVYLNWALFVCVDDDWLGHTRHRVTQR